MTERGPIYGVELIETLPLGGGVMLQQMPTRGDLQWVRTHGDRVAAGYEVLLSHWRQAIKERDEALAELQKTLDAGAVWEGAYRESQQESASEIERLARELASAQYNIRRWQNGTQVVGSHRSCSCAICETLYGVDADSPTDKREQQLAAAKELLREVLTENARMGNDVVLLTKKWRERAKEVTETPDR